MRDGIFDPLTAYTGSYIVFPVQTSETDYIFVFPRSAAFQESTGGDMAVEQCAV